MLEWKPRLVLALIAAAAVVQLLGALKGILPVKISNHGW